MSEFIGSRIALISKSDIKYVGTLHEINSESSTVALEKVTSYGTEGRKGNPDEEIPGSDQVYEYIVFRGSDVKELSIVEAPKENKPPQMPNDPAILGSARPQQQSQSQTPQQPQQPQPPQQNQFPGPQQPYPPPYGYPSGPPPNQFQQQPRFAGPGGPHGFPGSPGAVPGYNMGYGPPPGYGMGYGPPPGQGFPQQPPPFSPSQQHLPAGPPGQMNQQRPPPVHGQQQGQVGSKHGTPQPPGDQSRQPPALGAPQKPAELSTTPAPPAATSTSGPPPPLDSKPKAPETSVPAPTQQQAGGKKPSGNRVAVPLLPKPTNKSAPNQPPPNASQPPQTYADATQAATAAVAAAMAKLGPKPHEESSPMDNLTQKVNQMRVQDGVGRGRGRGRGAPRGARRESGQRPVDVPREDYDFETANAKFNKQDLVKEAIASGSPVTSPINGATPNPLENGHAADGEAEEIVIPAKASTEKGYDKKSSFFDNISSDLKDRHEQAEGLVDGRAIRREERSKNMETFGQGSVDGGFGRGGFRGRGRGRGFGRGGRGFGAGRGGFDPSRAGARGRGNGTTQTGTTDTA